MALPSFEGASDLNPLLSKPGGTLRPVPARICCADPSRCDLLQFVAVSTDSRQHDDRVAHRHRKLTLALTVALLAVTALLCGCGASTLGRQAGSTTRSA